MLLYEIADDVHWLMLTDVKYIKKSVCVLRVACMFTNATYEQTADLSLYIYIHNDTCYINWDVMSAV